MSTSNSKKIIYLQFPPNSSGRPVVCNLSKDFGICFNILKASISPRNDGEMTLELRGSKADIEMGIEYLEAQGVHISSVAQRVSRSEDDCMHCGACTALCPTRALELDLESREVHFDAESCSACGLCVTVCPVKAMQADLESE